MTSTWSVEHYTANRLPFTVHPACPACLGDPTGRKYTVEYRTSRSMDGVDVVRFGDQPDPHLRVTCAGCGFQWQMEVARPC